MLGLKNFVPECADGGRGIEDDLRPVDAVHHPVLRVVTPVTDVHSDAAELGLRKDRSFEN